MNTEDYDDDLDSFDSWVEEYRKRLEDSLGTTVRLTFSDENTTVRADFVRGEGRFPGFVKGTVPFAHDDSRLKVYEDYLNRKDGE